MEGAGKITGLKEAMAAMGAAFPSNPEQQRRLLNSAMSGAAKGSIVQHAKRLAMQSDGSGALSESIGVRTQKKGAVLAKGVAAGVEVVPVRSNRKAIAMYISHYFASRGKAAPAKMATSGIRHGHLVEFGTVHSAARPFLWPSAQMGTPAYIKTFAATLKRRTEAAVRRRAKIKAKSKK